MWTRRLQQEVLEVITHSFMITQNQLLGIGRRKGPVQARWALMRALRKSGMSLSEIGNIMHRDHTTILHGLKKSENLMADKEFTEIVNQVLAVLNGQSQAPRKSPTTERSHLKGQRFYNVYEGKCMVCGFTEILEIHHRLQKGDPEFNNPKYILILCPNHHTLLHLGELLIKDVPELQRAHLVKSTPTA